MTTLKEALVQSGLRNVSSYINSGNIIFESEENDIPKLVSQFELLLTDKFSVSTRVAIISVDALQAAWSHAPSWWGVDSESKHNAIFVIAPAYANEVAAGVGETKPDYEKIEVYEPIIFWSAPLSTFSRTRWSKIVGTKEYDSVTIRNYNTVRRLVALSK